MTIARQADLPGMTDRKLKDIHEAALVYADARDARVAASAPEVDAKQKLLELMKQHKIEHYKFDGVECDLIHEKENVKVKVHPADDGSSDEVRQASDDGEAMPELPEEQQAAVSKVKTKKKAKQRKAKK